MPRFRTTDHARSDAKSAARRSDTAWRGTILTDPRVVPVAGLAAAAGGPMIRRMSRAAATLAKDQEKSVWVRDTGGHWVIGRIRGLTEGQAIVELADGSRTTVALADVHDAPPPDIGLDPAPNGQQLATRPEPGGLGSAAAAQATSPRVTQLYQLLAGLNPRQRDSTARLWMLRVHPDKPGADPDEFIAIKLALDMHRNGTPPHPTTVAQPLALTFQDPGPHPLVKELDGQPFSAADREVLRRLPQVTGPADLAKLAATGRSASVLAVIGSLSSVWTVDGIVRVAGLPRKIRELIQLDRLGAVIHLGDLLALAQWEGPIARLTGIDGFRQVRNRRELEQVTALRATDAELATLAGIGQAAQVADLVALAQHLGPRTAQDLVSIAQLRADLTITDITGLAALARPVPDLQAIAPIALITTPADLMTVATCPCPVARLTTLAPLAQLHNPAQLVQLAAVAPPEADLVQLAGLGQAASLANLLLLAGALVGTRTAADVVTIAGIGSATFAAPTAAEIVQLCALPKTGAEVAQLSAADGIATTAQLIALTHRTDTKERVDNDWDATDARWGQLENGWAARWPLPVLFAAMHARWRTVAPVMQRMPRARALAAAPADLQAYAMMSAEMTHALDLLAALGPAVDEGAVALADADRRLADLGRLLAEIDNQFIPFYPPPSAARNTVNAQRVAVVNAQATLNVQRNQILAERGAFAVLNALTAAGVAQAAADQHQHAVAIGAVQDAAAISLVLQPIRTQGYLDRLACPNLNLSVNQTGHGFWQSLQQPEKARWNLKLAGFPVTGWAQQGYPGTRTRQHGYNHGPILIPTLAGFPCAVSGEIVHDWVFNTLNHGHPAAQMRQKLQLALNGQPYQAGPHMQIPPNPPVNLGGGRVSYGWGNLTIDIIVDVPTNTLITYFNRV